VFALLVFEMVVFMSLIIPLPFSIKRSLFTFISESPIIAKLQYGLKVRQPMFIAGRWMPSNKEQPDHIHLHPHPLH
jgi:hypothetical protein